MSLLEWNPRGLSLLNVRVRGPMNVASDGTELGQPHHDAGLEFCASLQNLQVGPVCHQQHGVKVQLHEATSSYPLYSLLVLLRPVTKTLRVVNITCSQAQQWQSLSKFLVLPLQ